jgi:hypothetical protein
MKYREIRYSEMGYRGIRHLGMDTCEMSTVRMLI